MKNHLFLCIAIIATLFLNSCGPDGDLYELTVEADYSEMLNDLGRDFSSEFHEVLESAQSLKVKQENADLVDLFFQQAEKMYPDKQLYTFFRNVHGIRPGLSNKQVKEKVHQRKEFLFDSFKSQLENLPEGYTLDAVEKVGPNKLKISVYSVQGEKALVRMFSRRKKFAMYEVCNMQEIRKELNKVRERMNPMRYEIDLEVEEDSASVYVEEEMVSNDASMMWRSLILGDNWVFAYCPPPNVRAVVDSLNTPEFNQHDAILYLPTDDLLEIQADGRKIKMNAIYACKVRVSEREKITGADVDVATAGYIDETGEHTVEIVMTEEGAKKFEALTAANIKESIAMVINDEYVLSAPNVMSTISQGKIQISGDFDEQETKELAAIIGGPGWNLPVRIIKGPTRK